MTGVGEALVSVATECPLCGARLDFLETKNAVRCGHCRSNLLVTGRRQLVSYTVAVRIDARAALAAARFTISASEPTRRVGEPRLRWTPYFRLTGEELCWRAPEAAPGRTARILELADELRIDPTELLARSAARESDVEPQISTRRIEHSLLAGEGSIGPPSLGVRSGVLELRLLDRAKAEAEGTILAATLPPSSARERMLHAPEGDRLLHRELLRVQLSTVYFPIWTVEIEARGGQRLVAIDGVSGSLVSRDAALSEPPASECASRARTLGLRPLVCPNCGNDLPLRPDDVVFHCASCRRAWLAQAGRLFEMRSTVIGAPPGVVTACHLPVWHLPGPTPDGPQAFAPAFRCRRLRALTDLAKRLRLARPVLESADDPPPDLVGCALDRQDAVALARFVAFELDEEACLRGSSARLLWLPFVHDGYAYREAHTGSPVQLRFDLAA